MAKFMKITLLLVIAPATIVDCIEESGIEGRGPILDKVYFLGVEKLSWYAASFYCEKSGWKLVTIESARDQANLMQFLSYYNINDRGYWSAGNRLSNDVDWRWGFESEEMNYTNWQNTDQQCQCVDTSDCVKLVERNLRWKGEDCFAELDFICQKNI
ncbi:unnamed protein product [Ceratitis capitata]|uniref:(Mediterranean fruit fly) hypothetical protein n=1 Tax=Ceratitis capitata TaxID=7213 RepID=A0A811UMJ6_CERCA|nr:unnamed protein product [Ceratitis capitata]